MKTIRIFLLGLLILFGACTKDNPEKEVTKDLTIFFVNDVHAQIDNFSKVKHIIDAERLNTNVMVVSSGDNFSGNPVVDNYPEKGLPIIEIMKTMGFDISTLGNHDFDYGADNLANLMKKSNFDWICANVDVGSSGVPQPQAYKTISAGNIKITFLGLVETGGKPGAIIPSSHPWKVKDFTFQRARDVVRNYSNLKSTEESDLLIALSHLGHSAEGLEMGDFQLAKENFFFDMIIGGHSHAIIDTIISNTPIYQSGGYLNYLGKIELSLRNKTLESSHFTLIDLDEYSEKDEQLTAAIEKYNDIPYLKEVIGYSEENLYRSEVGCFYTDALRQQMNVDVCFQNTGGVRAGLMKGDILIKNIYEIEPFNNGSVIYKMTVRQIKDLLIGTGSGFYYSGIKIYKSNGSIVINDLYNRTIPDDYVLSLGINDYIPAVHEAYFPDNGIVQPLSAAETMIAFLKNHKESINYKGCYRYFRY